MQELVARAVLGIMSRVLSLSSASLIRAYTLERHTCDGSFSRAGRAEARIMRHSSRGGESLDIKSFHLFKGRRFVWEGTKERTIQLTRHD